LNASQDALVDDLIASGILLGGIAFTGRAMRPPFEDDPQTVARELERLVRGGAKRCYMGHGGPLEADEGAAACAALVEDRLYSMQVRPLRSFIALNSVRQHRARPPSLGPVGSMPITRLEVAPRP
jgi:hypothetical protein